jgi:hypothetical protein
LGPHFGSVVSRLTTTSGSMSATTALSCSTSNTLATTGLAPCCSISDVFVARLVSPTTS